jgi:hypothetical protein
MGRIRTDYQTGNGVVRVLFRNAEEENPYIVTITTPIGAQINVASRIQGKLSEKNDGSISVRPNMLPDVIGVIF